MREHQKRHVITPVSGHHQVLHQRRQCRQCLDAQSAHIDPGSGGEFEILRDAAVEIKAALRMPFIDETHPIADAVEPFLVEGDVYKRQEFHVARDVLVVDQIPVGPVLDLVAEGIAPVVENLASLCLLYTSRCV